MNVRILRLARIAAEAEGLRLRRRLRRAVIRCILGLVALIWLFGAAVLAHIAVWNWLRDSIGWTALGAAWTLCGVDALVGVAAALIAGMLGPGRVELEALAVRSRAIEAATTSIAISSMLMQALRLGINLVRRRNE